ncbi:uncharacterized protein LOC135224481 [Macrobrachium nipponense]|uniref:uncharacterized protein LOC135224481 n=1 Tax=Macrobrachium nipponense TaxID=159736 RepID=UPI0030C7BF91
MGSQTMLRILLLTGLATLCTAEVDIGYNRRITQEERDKAFERLAEWKGRKASDPLCEPPNPSDSNSDPPFPRLPKSYITRMEIAFQDNMTVIEGEEMFDGVKNAGVLKYKLAEGVFSKRPHVFQEEIHYSVPNNEALFIFGNNACEDEGGEDCHPLKLCFGGDLSDLSEEMKNLLGYSDLNPDEGFMGAGGILQWGPEYGYTYHSVKDCRGMYCDVYETCVKVDDSDNRLHIVYYWSQADWSLNTKHEQVPVAIEMTSSGTMDPVTVKPFRIRYDFYDFVREAKPDAASLEPPNDVYCYGMKDGTPPPATKNYFAYKSETVTGFDVVVPDGENQTTTIQFTAAINQEEFYDWDQKIATSEFVPWFLFTEESRYLHKTKRVQDFNQGLHYSIKIHLHRCIIRPIENLTTFGDVIVNEDGTIEMLPPWMFDHMDEPMKYTGKHWIRGMETDAWIGTQKNPIITFLNNSYVWYYTSPFTADPDSLEAKSGNAQPYSMDPIPVYFEKYLSLFEALPHKIYNIYAYEDEPPMTHTIDVSPCYASDQMLHFTLDLPADTLQKIKFLRDQLRYVTQIVLAGFGEVSPLRINRLVLDERPDVIRVLFTILDRPTVEGDGSGAEEESTMQDAASKINDALKNHQVIILIPISANADPAVITILPVSTSLTPVSRANEHQYTTVHDKGYNSGSMAGMAFGMLFAGAVVALGTGMVLRKRKTKSDDLPRVAAGLKASETPGVYLSGNLAAEADT